MNALKKLFRKFIPAIARTGIWKCEREFGLIAEYIRDWKRYRTNSAFNDANRDIQILTAQIMIDYHRVEKGLALQNPRLGFGRAVILRLISNLDSFLAANNPDFIINDAIASLNAYIQIQHENNTLSEEILNAYNNLIKKHKLDKPDCQLHQLRATETVTRQDILESVNINYENFIKQRHSIRNFSDRPIEISLLERSVDLARHAPSVCNRQAWHTHIITDPERIDHVLQIQRGALSFKDCVGALMLITTNQKRFFGAGERNQQWVDGGIFLMSQILALHAVGLGACCLNWCGGRNADRALQHELNLPSHQSIIAAIAIGHLPEKFEVARSNKAKASDIITYH